MASRTDPPEPAHWFALAGEDAGHFDTVTRLVDRVCEHNIDWFTPETRDHVRGWRASQGGGTYWKLKDAFKTARARGLPVHGHFSGEPGAAQAGMFRAQFFLWQAECTRGRAIHVGVVARDVDRNHPETGAKQALGERAWSFRVVFAFPDPEIEVWLVAGFVAANDAESRLLRTLQAELAFSPVTHPERLTSTTPGAPRDAKRVLRDLTSGDSERTDACREASLEVLESNGARCGLAAFLGDVSAVVVPVLTGPAKS